MMFLALSIIFIILVVRFLYVKLSCGIIKSSVCLVGKTAIVTGANSGIGYSAVLILASRGCRVIMADVADMEKSKENVIKYTNNRNIVSKKLDLSSLQSVRDFAADVIRSEVRLDILLNNAGIGASDSIRTADGLNPVMQVNYLGHFLLTHLLIDLMKKSAPSRIVFTSSRLSHLNNLTPENLNIDTKVDSLISSIRLYGNSKLCIIIASRLFGHKLKGSGVTANAIHPAIVRTPIYGQYYTTLNISSVFSLTTKLINLIYGKTSWEGAQTLVHVAISQKLEQVTGKFFGDCQPTFQPRLVGDKKFCDRIWKMSEELVGLRSEEKIV